MTLANFDGVSREGFRGPGRHDPLDLSEGLGGHVPRKSKGAWANHITPLFLAKLSYLAYKNTLSHLPPPLDFALTWQLKFPHCID